MGFSSNLLHKLIQPANRITWNKSLRAEQHKVGPVGEVWLFIQKPLPIQVVSRGIIISYYNYSNILIILKESFCGHLLIIQHMKAVL